MLVKLTPCNDRSEEGVYTGDFRNNFPDGIGTMVYFEAAKGSGSGAKNYTGMWRKGQKHGTGIMFWNNGDRYVLLKMKMI